MNTETGAIRDLTEGKKSKGLLAELGKLEIEITQEEKKEMLKHAGKDRFKELEKSRRKQLQAVNRMKTKRFIKRIFR